MELEASPASHIPVSCEATWSRRRGVVEKGWRGEALPAVCHLRTLCEGALGCPHRAVSGLMSVFRQHSAVTGDSRGWLPPPKVSVKHLWQEQLTRLSLAFVSGLIMLSLVSIGPVPEHGPLSSLPQGTAVKQTKCITEWFSTSHRLVAPGLGLWSPKRSLLQLWHAWRSEGMLALLALPGSPALTPSCPRVLALSPASKTLEFLLFFGVSAPTWDTDPFLYCLQFFLAPFLGLWPPNHSVLALLSYWMHRLQLEVWLRLSQRNAWTSLYSSATSRHKSVRSRF